MKKTLFLLFYCFIFLSVQAQPKKIKHIVLIGCDGFGAYAIPEAKMPNLKKMMKDGASSLKARSVLPSSSAVNWASMLMGAGPTIHGYTEWGSKVPEIPFADSTSNKKFPSIFSLIHKQLPNAQTALIYSWSGIAPLLELNNITTVVAGPSGDNDDFCTDAAAKIIKDKKPLLTFLHLSEPDGTGHNKGHNTPAYYEQLQKLDLRIGKILKAVEEAGIGDETIILLSADHGGIKKGHGGKTLQEVEIPWIITGKDVKPDFNISDVIITYDTAATIAWLLKLEVPQSWRGQAVKSAFKN